MRFNGLGVQGYGSQLQLGGLWASRLPQAWYSISMCWRGLMNALIGVVWKHLETAHGH